MSGRVRERPAAHCIMRTVKHVLVVDDEPAIVEIVRDYLSDAPATGSQPRPPATRR